MTSEEQSLILFNKAIDLKRKGNFNDSLKMYVKSMQVYPDDPKGMEAFNAMGKVFYLEGNLANAVKCYTIYNRLCALKNPVILRDYQKMLKGSSTAENSLLDAYYNVAAHWSWSKARAELARKHVAVNKNEQIYLNSILGRESYSSLSKEQQLVYNQYENLCRNKGYQLIFDDFQEMLDNPAKAKKELNQYIDEILDTIKQLPINDASLYRNTTTRKNSATDNVSSSDKPSGKTSVKPVDNLTKERTSTSHSTPQNTKTKNTKKPSKIAYGALLAFAAVVVGAFLFGTYLGNHSEEPGASYVPTKSVAKQENKQDTAKDTSKKSEQKQNNQKKQDKDKMKASVDSLQNDKGNTENNSTSRSDNSASPAPQEPQVDVEGAKAAFNSFVYDAGSGDYQAAYSYVEPKAMSYDDFVYLNKKRKTFSQGITVTDIHPDGDGNVFFRFTKATGTEGSITMTNDNGWKVLLFSGVYSGID